MKNLKIDKKGVEFLTPREKETLKYIVLGLTNKEIAQKMGITHHTVKAFIASMFDKLGGGRRSDLAIRALIYKIVEINPDDFSI